MHCFFSSWLNIYKWFTGQVLDNEGEETNRMKCIAVNPGRLAKGEGGGTFVELDYSGGLDKINASILAIWIFCLEHYFSGTFVKSMSYFPSINIEKKEENMYYYRF